LRFKLAESAAKLETTGGVPHRRNFARVAAYFFFKMKNFARRAANFCFAAFKYKKAPLTLSKV
jgi:hypothetical protein